MVYMKILEKLCAWIIVGCYLMIPFVWGINPITYYVATFVYIIGLAIIIKISGTNKNERWINITNWVYRKAFEKVENVFKRWTTDGQVLQNNFKTVNKYEKTIEFD